jgi:hypothetical protein
VSEVETGLEMSEAKFRSNYGFEKPSADELTCRPVVLYCMSGLRARCQFLTKVVGPRGDVFP